MGRGPYRYMAAVVGPRVGGVIAWIARAPVLQLEMIRQVCARRL